MSNMLVAGLVGAIVGAVILGYPVGRLRPGRRLGDWAEDQVRFGGGSWATGGIVRQGALSAALWVTQPRRMQRLRHTPLREERVPPPQRDPHWVAKKLAESSTASTDRATAEVPPVAGSLREGEVLAVAEEIFRACGGQDSYDRELAGELLPVVLGSVRENARAEYLVKLREFGEAHLEKLVRLFQEYGPGSALAAHGRFEVLSAGPAGVVVCERLDSARFGLLHAWEEGELPEKWLRDMCEGWGVRTP